VEGDRVALSKTADCICANRFGLVIESLVGRCQDQQAGLGRRCRRAVGLRAFYASFVEDEAYLLSFPASTGFRWVPLPGGLYAVPRTQITGHEFASMQTLLR
jgi:hypothetical protein